MEPTAPLPTGLVAELPQLRRAGPTLFLRRLAIYGSNRCIPARGQDPGVWSMRLGVLFPAAARGESGVQRPLSSLGPSLQPLWSVADLSEHRAHQYPGWHAHYAELEAQLNTSAGDPLPGLRAHERRDNFQS